MKITGAFVLLTLAVLCSADTQKGKEVPSQPCDQTKIQTTEQASDEDKSGIDCSEYRTLERARPIYCERLYQPFCGSDGKTYNNKCSFCKAVLSSRGALRMKQAGAC
ncbi:ovomucoid [Opisthocomus hoazin]|uniref:ovomucoid n=1 Tax=Opisthocomus hoazin TaxID=30419 RepID=UPI0005224D41|nr:PREDICTED: serine protease inhibitor Kazal-type 9 [Opisthocomus hoazin]